MDQIKPPTVILQFMSLKTGEDILIIANENRAYIYSRVEPRQGWQPANWEEMATPYSQCSHIVGKVV